MENNIDGAMVSNVSSDVKAQPTQLKDVSTIFKETLDLFKERALGFYGLMLLCVGFVGLITILVGLMFVIAGIFGALFLCLGVVFICLAFLWLSLASCHYSSTNSRVIDSYKVTWPKLRSYSWMLSLFALVNLGGYLLFFIPGIIVSVWIGFSYFIFLCEGKSGMDVLLRSYSYVKGRWLAVFIRLLLPGLAIILVSMLFGKNNSILSIVNFILSPFYAFYAYRLYVTVKDSYVGPDSYDEGKRKLFIGLSIVAILGILLAPIVVLFFMIAA